MMTRAKFTALAAALIIAIASAGTSAFAGSIHNETARFLAGMKPAADSPVAGFTKDATWQQHARQFDGAWAKLDKQQLSRVHAWSATHVKAPPRPLFYTFSGPDFAYANAFFPDATTYVLAGLEPVGPIPSINDRTRNSLGALRASMNTILNISFFITSDMQSRLRDGELRGTIPILYVFIARAGKTIHEVSLVDLQSDGTVQEVERHATAKRGAPRVDPGVKIVFSGSGGARQTLYYFATDLSDSGTKSSGFLAFCEKLGTGDGLVKSASYLLHGGNFSRVREMLLDRVQTLVQDDTGIPVRLFKKDEWDLKPFGAYLGPIEIFKRMYQPQLAQLFRQGRPPKLDFGIGYRWRGHDSNLLLAVKKSTIAQGN